jgi:branched-chain amino acid transport system substrate-binding protein
MIGVVGNLASSINLSTQVVYSECGMTQISPSSSNDVLTTRGYKTFLRTEPPNAFQSAKGADFVASLPQVKRVAVIDTNDATTKAQAQLFIDDIKKKPGLTVVAHENVTENGVDFRGALTSVIAAKPDLIYVPGFFNDAALMVKQSRELGYKGTFLGIDSDVTPDFISVAGAENAEGVYMTNLGLDPVHTTAAEKFVTAYRDEYHSDPITYASNAFDAANAIIAAWKAAGATDRAKVLDEIHKLKIPGTSGPVSFTSTGELTNPTASVFQVQKGKLVYLGPI